MVVEKAHGHHIGKALHSATIATLQNTALVTSVSFYALSVVFCAGQSSCDRKTGNQHHKGLEIWYREWLALHWIPGGILHAWNHY